MMDFPTIIIATPCFNSVDTIDETVHSVLAQFGRFHLRYHVQDGGSTDGTVERLERWGALLRNGQLPTGMKTVEFTFDSAVDHGMYDALNSAFQRLISAGQSDIMTWINSDDRLALGAAQTAVAIFGQHETIQWLGGRHSFCDESGCPTVTLPVNAYARQLLALGLYEDRRLFFLQQEGVFWRAKLWHAAGGSLDSQLRLAGDFELWCRLAQHAEYVSVDTVLGQFRVRRGRLTSDLERYFAELDVVVSNIRDERDRFWSDLQAGTISDLKGPVAVYDAGNLGWRTELRDVYNKPRPGPGSAPKEFVKRQLQKLRRFFV
jgi:hypothetical protein